MSRSAPIGNFEDIYGAFPSLLAISAACLFGVLILSGSKIEGDRKRAGGQGEEGGGLIQQWRD